MTIFVWTLFGFFEKKSKFNHINIVTKDLDSSRQEYSVRGLGFVVAHLVFRDFFVSVYRGSNPAVVFACSLYPG